MIELKFGYLPIELTGSFGSIRIETLSGLEDIKRRIESSKQTFGSWIYSPLQTNRDILSDRITTRPYQARLFDLPKTHTIRHSTSEHIDHTRFLIWCIGFLLGVRTTDVDFGFIDAAPIKAHEFVDFYASSDDLSAGLEAADRFYLLHRRDKRIAKALLGAIHSFNLSCNPNLLDYEIFIYRYTAIEGCHYVHSRTIGTRPAAGRHAQRLRKLCEAYGIHTPVLADEAVDADSTLASERNKALPEGLFFDEPFGYEIFGGNRRRQQTGVRANALLEMRCLICRLIVALLGMKDAFYGKTPLNTRGKWSLELARKAD